MQLRTTRLTATVLIGAIAVASIAPAAYAGHGRGNGNGNGYGHRKWERSDYTSSSCSSGGYYRNGFRTRMVYRDHGSSVGPALAGLVGGFILGAAVSHASSDPGYRSEYRDRDYSGYRDRDYCPQRHTTVSAGFYYYDPYCETRYSSMDACSDHFSHARHPQVVQVVETRTHRVVKRYTYEDGDWSPYASNYGDRGYGDEEYSDN